MPVTWDEVKAKVQSMAAEEGEWAGLPLPIDNFPLVLEKRHPKYKTLNAGCLTDQADEDFGIKVRNMWRTKDGKTVVVFEEDGKLCWCYLCERMDRLVLSFKTLGVAASPAWSVGAETEAQHKLLHHVGDHKFKLYMMTGTFTETSPRSGVTYMFRRLRPTLALRPHEQSGMRVLAALCLHPIGYYEGTWGGVMVPTDCVLAHLLLMRADEHLFWRKANQHSPLSAEAGI